MFTEPLATAQQFVRVAHAQRSGSQQGDAGHGDLTCQASDLKPIHARIRNSHLNVCRRRMQQHAHLHGATLLWAALMHERGCTAEIRC
jgi:hypothetical protein